jgi:pyruvate oxidase
MIGQPNVSDVVIDVLVESGARHLFGIPGDAINHLIEAVRGQDTMRFIQVRHEEAGALAASAQAKLTENPGACTGTAGPGGIHLLNGLYDAKRDYAPVIAVTGQVATSFVGSNYHQEVDLKALFQDVAAFNQVVMSAAEMPRAAVQACQKAIDNKTPSHLSLPVDIASASVSHADQRRRIFHNDARVMPAADDARRAAGLLNDAKRVAILAGIGAADASDQLLAVAEKLGAPIIKTLRAKDILPDEHPLCVGGLGLLGTRPAIESVEECDALLLVGTDFPYPSFYPDGVPAVQIELEASRLGNRYPIEVGLVGHAREALAQLADELSPKRDRAFLKRLQSSMADWWTRMDRIEDSDDVPIRPQAVARIVGQLAAEDAVFTCDTGAVTVWGARNLRIRGQQRFTLSANLASMGFALPGAIGAQLAFPQRQVIALAGDGGLGMFLGEYLTAVKYELPITVVVFNNQKLGLIQMEQEVEGDPEYQTHLHNADFAELARSCGGEGRKVTQRADLRDALHAALTSNRPYVVDVIVNPEERTMPPRIEPAQAFGYALAKTKEFFGLGDAGS